MQNVDCLCKIPLHHHRNDAQLFQSYHARVHEVNNIMQLKILLVSIGAAENDGVNAGFLSLSHTNIQTYICTHTYLNIGSTGVQNGE